SLGKSRPLASSLARTIDRLFCRCRSDPETKSEPFYGSAFHSHSHDQWSSHVTTAVGINLCRVASVHCPICMLDQQCCAVFEGVRSLVDGTNCDSGKHVPFDRWGCLCLVA